MQTGPFDTQISTYTQRDPAATRFESIDGFRGSIKLHVR